MNHSVNGFPGARHETGRPNSLIADDLPRALPEAAEAERGILGAILLDPPALGITREIVADGDFASPHHQRVYRALLDLAERGEMIDNLSLTARLRQKGELADIGGLPISQSYRAWSRHR